MALRLTSARPVMRGLFVLAALVALAAGAWLLNRTAQPDIQRGRELYAAFCASCHGANLEGQENWRSPKPDGTLPAPPHDAEGHTWHHTDDLLFDYVKRGGEAVLEDMGMEFSSAMPGFGDVLADEDIESILAFIKSTWPEDIQRVQNAAE